MHTRTHNNHAKYATTKYFREHVSAGADAGVLWKWMRIHAEVYLLLCLVLVALGIFGPIESTP